SLFSETASFRDPGGQLYHATLPLPPVSTVIGIAGAALGYCFQRTWEFFQTKNINVGVRDISRSHREKPPGKGLDLWRYQKIAGKEVRSDVLKREFLLRPGYRLYYGCGDKTVLEQLRQAFIDPAWALSLGTSDDLAQVREVSHIEPIRETSAGDTALSFCLIPGDHSNNYSFDWAAIQGTPERVSLELPMVKLLPSGFIFGPGEERKGCEYKPFTFLAGVHSLKKACPAYCFSEDVVPLISIKQEQ
ncbi:MAG TPA: hypothetical protein DCZ10_07145, partial [Pelotomaculum sp.]|nr:hypothetical protein [Pelotomaculum sp.]